MYNRSSGPKFTEEYIVISCNEDASDTIHANIYNTKKYVSTLNKKRSQCQLFSGCFKSAEHFCKQQ